jgi:iron(III) transport system substrate-binding protein
MRVAAGIYSLFLLFVLASNSPAQTNWRNEWEKLVKAAKEEGRLTIYGVTVFEDVFKYFQKQYPEIKLSYVVGRGAGIAPRLMQERRAGKYLADIYVGGIHSAYELFYRSKVLDPIPPALILPEVLDESKWWRGKHHYVDHENQYIFVFEGSVQGGGISYNKKLVDPQEFKSFWDLLNPKWRGKAVILHPRTPGMISQSLTFIYHNPKLGAEYIRKLFAEMDVTVSRDDAQMVDWLGSGPFALNFFGRGIGTAEGIGLPVREFYAGSFKEGAFVNPLNGSVSLPSQAPHPNATKLALNWLLSRAGQIAFQKATNDRAGNIGADSLREDIPKDDVFPPQRRAPGIEYLVTARPELMNMKPIIDLAEKTLNEAQNR